MSFASLVCGHFENLLFDKSCIYVVILHFSTPGLNVVFEIPSSYSMEPWKRVFYLHQKYKNVILFSSEGGVAWVSWGEA
jgi:hypothetical protein